MFTDEELEEMAVLAIYNYFNGEYTKDYIKENFKLALKVLVENIKGTSKLTGVSSISENGTSITYKDGYEKFTLTSDVLALLPKKKNFKVW
jgi:hypothetical protein